MSAIVESVIYAGMCVALIGLIVMEIMLAWGEW